MKDNSIKLKGFFHVEVTENTADGIKVVGDSGWKENLVTNTGVRDYLVNPLMGVAGKAVSYIALGTGGAPLAADVSLSGELIDTSSARVGVSTSLIASKTAQFTAAFASSNSFITTTHNISNVGLFETSTTAGGSLFAGNTYTSSSIATNQNVNVSYQIRFS